MNLYTYNLSTMWIHQKLLTIHFNFTPGGKCILAQCEQPNLQFASFCLPWRQNIVDYLESHQIYRCDEFILLICKRIPKFLPSIPQWTMRSTLFCRPKWIALSITKRKGNLQGKKWLKTRKKWCFIMKDGQDDDDVSRNKDRDAAKR